MDNHAVRKGIIYHFIKFPGQLKGGKGAQEVTNITSEIRTPTLE